MTEFKFLKELKTNGSKKDLILKHMYAIDAMIY